MTRLHYPLPDVPGYHLVHAHDEGERCVITPGFADLSCRYRPTRFTRLRQRALRLFRSAP